ncbi:CrcB protein [Corynebacterium sp. HMSC06G04]|nr:CrcB protein [Corynebacterium sp. HMSC06G04]
MARYGFTKVLPSPVSTFAANMCGALAIGLAYGFIEQVSGALSEVLYPLAIVGFAGGLSTWSTLAKELGEMLKEKRYWKCIQYLFFTLALGIVLAWRGAMWAPIIYQNF